MDALATALLEEAVLDAAPLAADTEAAALRVAKVSDLGGVVVTVPRALRRRLQHAAPPWTAAAAPRAVPNSLEWVHAKTIQNLTNPP